jgi:UDP-glucose 4-epimerase
MKRILVTGGAGFIGSHIVDAYIQRGYEVDIIDNLSTGSLNNVNKKAELFKIDILDEEIGKIFKERRYEIVSHHAAQMNVRVSVEKPIFDVQNNIIGTVNILNNCVKNGVKYFIFASTGGAIYGEQNNYPTDETHSTNPDSPYGISKLTGEKFLNYFFKSYGLQYVALRYANVYGPRQNPYGEAGVVAIFSKKMLNGEKVVIFGDGKQTRDFVFVEDVVRANLIVLENRPVGCYNISTGIETNINDIFREIANLTEYELPPQYEPPRKGEQRRSVLDYSKAKKVFGWKPEINLKSGLEKTVEYFKDINLN